MKSKKGIVKYIIAFSIPVLCMLVHMICRDCYPFGNNTVLLGDANVQYYWFEEMLLDKIKNGESILFSWQAGLGFEFYQNFFYYLASPFNIIAMIIGNWDMELGVVATMLVQVGMCSVTMLFYLRHTSKNKLQQGILNDSICLLFSLTYALGDYFLAYQYNYIWLISLMLAPLVMLGVEYLVEGRCVKLYIITLTLVFITNFYFAWFMCILSFVWYIDTCRGSIRQIGRLTLRYAISSVISAMISAFSLLPCYLAISGRTNAAIEEGLNCGRFGSFADYVQSFLFGSPIDQAGHGYFTYNNYVGVSVLCMALLFLVNRNMDKASRVKRFLEIAILSLALNWEVGSYIFHGFTLPNSYSNRFAFILSIILIITAFEELVNIDKLRIKDLVVVVTVFAVLVVYALTCSTDIGDITSYLVTIFIVIYCLICVTLWSRQSIGRKALFANIVVVCLLELVSNYFLVMGTCSEISQENKRGTKEWIDVYDALETGVGERKTSWMASQVGMGNSDTSIFTSVIDKNMINLYKSLGMSYQGNSRSYTYRGTTPVIDAMFNVRYVLTDHDIYFGGYDLVKADTIYNNYTGTDMTYGIYENKYLSGMGYMVLYDINNWTFNDNDPFAVQNSFIRQAFGLPGVFEELDIIPYNVSAFGCEIIGENVCDITYRNIWEIDGLFYAANTYSFDISEDMHLYIYIQDSMGVFCSVSIDDKDIVSDSSYISPAEMLDIGEVKKGQKIKLKVSNNSKSGYTSTTHVKLCKYNDDVMNDALVLAERYKYEVTRLDGASVEGLVKTEQDGVLYTSIPYYKGTTAYVDGKKTNITIIGDALCGVELTSGEHSVKFTYFPYGMKLGIFITLCGILIAAFYIKWPDKISNCGNCK